MLRFTVSIARLDRVTIDHIRESLEIKEIHKKKMKKRVKLVRKDKLNKTRKVKQLEFEENHKRGRQ